MEEQRRAEGYSRHNTQDDYHADEGLILRDPNLNKGMQCANPLERAENKRNLYQPGGPWSADNQQSNQHRRSNHANGIAVAHEMGTKDDKAENDRKVDQRFLHDYDSETLAVKTTIAG